MSDSVSDKKLPPGIQNPGTLDALTIDAHSGRVVVAMFEVRPWNLGDMQLYQLQEKLNAYASFILDGEMHQAYPQTVDRPVEIQLRSIYEPSDEALLLLEQVREQLSFQDIALEAVKIDEQMAEAQADAEAQNPQMHNANGGGCCQGNGSNGSSCCQS
ncbi:MAG: DUF6572 domain-containing protein [Chthoniobacterales bacterium]